MPRAWPEAADLLGLCRVCELGVAAQTRPVDLVPLVDGPRKYVTGPASREKVPSSCRPRDKSRRKSFHMSHRLIVSSVTASADVVFSVHVELHVYTYDVSAPFVLSQW